MNKLKQVFVDEVGLESWEEAVSTYPQYATKVALEKFSTLKSLSDAAVIAFENYFRRAVLSTACSCTGAIKKQYPDGDARNDVFWITVNPEQLSYQGVVSQIPAFNGFSVCVAHLSTLSSQQVNECLYLCHVLLCDILLQAKTVL